MIDLDAMRKCRRVTWKLARQNLALLDHYFWLRSSRTDRYRFLKTYLDTRSEPPRRSAGLPGRSKTRRGSGRNGCGGGGAGGAGRRTSTSRSFAGRSPGAWPRAIWIRLKSSPCWTTRTCRSSGRGATLLKNSRTTTVAETTMLVRGQPDAVIYKRFNRKKWLDPLFTLFRPSARMAVVAGRAGPRQPRHPDASEPRRTCRGGDH